MKKAIIVGATSGIGRALAQQLVLHNYKVGITGRRSELLISLQKENQEAYKISCFDCTTAIAVSKLEALKNTLGGVDLFIFCSGRGDMNKELLYDIEEKTNQLNVIAFTKIINWGYREFQTKNKGHLVVISSIAGLRGSRIAPAYNASKAYQINYLEGLRQKAKKEKPAILVSDIRPGFVNTAMAKGEGLFWVCNVQKAAKQIYSLLHSRKSVGYVSKRWRVIAIVFKIIPRKLYAAM